MAKVSKNIRRLRTERAMTQEELAEQLCVTRQTISGWENDRTQPDIDMLEKLSEVLGADIEELIYGKKRNVGLEDSKARSRKAMNILLAVIGSLLAAVGVVILFVLLWERLPIAVKAGFAFLPLLAGAGLALFVLIKKAENTVSRESCAVLWEAAVVITNALVNGLFNTEIGFLNLLFIDIVLILPIMFIMDSAAAFTAALGSTLVWYTDCLSGRNMPYTGFAVPVFILMLAVCAAFVLRDKKRRAYTLWPSLFGGTYALAAMLTALSDAPELTAFLLAFGVTAALFAAGGDKGAPFRTFAQVLICPLSIAFIIFAEFDAFDCRFDAGLVPSFIVPALIIICSAVFGRKTLLADKYRAVFFGLECAAFLLTLIVSAADGDFDDALWIYTLLNGVIGIVTTARGVTLARLSAVNLGLVTVIASIYIVIIAIEPEPLVIGLSFLIVGCLILAVNKLLMKKFRERKENGEVDNNA